MSLPAGDNVLWSIANTTTHHISGGDLAPSLGDGNFFRGPTFLNDVFFRRKFPFSRPKIRFSVSLLCKMSYITLIWPFLHKKKHYFRKEFLDDTYFLLCSSFRARPATLLLKILGGQCMGRSPTSNFGGPSPQSPRSPPLHHIYLGDWGRSPPQSLRWGDGPCFGSPPMFGENVIFIFIEYSFYRISIHVLSILSSSAGPPRVWSVIEQCTFILGRKVGYGFKDKNDQKRKKGYQLFWCEYWNFLLLEKVVRKFYQKNFWKRYSKMIFGPSQVKAKSPSMTTTMHWSAQFLNNFKRSFSAACFCLSLFLRSAPLSKAYCLYMYTLYRWPVLWRIWK